MNQQQQGDVLIHRLDKLPKGLKLKTSRQGLLILAEGEATGHSHSVLESEAVSLFEDADGTLFLKVDSPVEVSHQEHNKQMIDKGIYEIGQVVEVDPFEEAVRKVAD